MIARELMVSGYKVETVEDVALGNTLSETFKNQHFGRAKARTRTAVLPTTVTPTTRTPSARIPISRWPTL